MINGLKIGFDLMILGLSLMMMYKELPKEKKKSKWWNGYTKRGVAVFVIGFLAVILKIAVSSEALQGILIQGGGAIMSLGVASIITGTIEAGKDDRKIVEAGGYFVAIIGFALVLGCSLALVDP